MKRVLFVAYHFPPILGSSGYLRTLKFTRFMPENGIEPTVLTVHPQAYPEWNEAQLKQIPEGMDVVRAFAMDAGRHLAIRGRYPRFLGIPDRFSTWIPFAVAKGISLIRKKRMDAIFSTYPIPSAHVIGGMLARMTGLPWVADFRDPMYDDVPELPGHMRIRRSIERRTMERCTHALVVTDGVRDLFIKRYGPAARDKITVIPNGFDDNDFKDLEILPRQPSAPVTFIHAGLLQQEDRDPVPFFRGIRHALDKGILRADSFQVKLMGTGNNDIYQKELVALKLEKSVQLLPPQPYAKALKEMADSDVLLLFQGPSCDPQIPAKLYEYLRIGKPILAVTTFQGETGRTVMATSSGQVVSWNDSEAIGGVLADWVEKVESGRPLPACSKESANAFSRQNQARNLARLLAALPGRS
jgi:glycosyltransferase involved in cell wall biosynthesis